VAGGAFAIGAGNMDGADPVLRIAQVFAQLQRIGEVLFLGGSANPA
jgi:hypothetical protein